MEYFAVQEASVQPERGHGSRRTGAGFGGDAQLFHQFPLARDAVEIADQQHAQQQFGVDGWPSRVAVTVLQLGSNKVEAHVAINQAKNDT